MGKMIEIVAVGDVMLADQYNTIGRGVGSVARRRGPHFAFDLIRAALHDADIVFGNLEAPLGRHVPLLWAANAFRGLPESAEGLSSAGFDVLGLANNHIMQHGPGPALETVNLLSQHQMLAVGLGQNELEARAPVGNH